jgi:nucleoid-associated protein YgaU
MGIFSFIRDAGDKLFEMIDPKKTLSAADAAQKNTEIVDSLYKRVKDLGLNVKGLVIKFTDGTATVTGAVASQADKEKVILAIGNTAGVGQVDDRMTVEAAAKPEPEAKFYTVVSGDTLSKIAKQHYGDANKYPVIFEANKPMLKHPDKIYPGQVLRIPPL